MICPKCGHDNPAMNRFCGMCGAQLERRRVAGEAKPATPASTSSILGVATHEPPAMAKPEPPKTEIAKTEVPPPKPPEAPRPVARDKEVLMQPRVEERAPQRVEPARPPVTKEPSIVYGTRSPEPPRTTQPPSRSSLAEKPAFVYDKQPFVYDKPAKQERPRAFVYDGDRPSSLSGPSFLGLGSNYAEEEPRRGWRAFAFLLAVAVIAGLIGLQWHRNGWQMPEAAGPAWQKIKAYFAGQQNNGPNTGATVTPAANTPPPADATPAPGKAGDITSDGKMPPNVNAASPSNATTPVAPTTKDQATSPQNNDDTANDNPSQPANPPQKISATRPQNPLRKQNAAPEETASQSDWEAPVALADNYINAKPQDCNRALQILNYAAEHGNPRAGVKLGGLYTAGVCVPQDNVMAYAWLTRALKLDPNNHRVQAARMVVWNQMSSEEQHRAGTQ